MGLTTRKTIEEIRSLIEKEGYKLISSVYIDAHHKIDMVCSKSHSIQTSWNGFQQGHRCPICSGKKKKTIEEVRAVFEARGFGLLTSVYVNKKSPLEYVCPNKHYGQISWDSFNQGKGCLECAGRKKKSLKEVKKLFEDKGYIVLSNIYTNNKQPMKVVCPNGHTTSIQAARFISGRGCPLCAKNRKKTPEEVENHIKSFGYIPDMGSYENCDSLITIMCDNGHKFETTGEYFYSGNRCPFCYKGRVSRISQEWLDFLGIGEDFRETTIKIGKRHAQRVDAYVPDTNTIYEFLGDYWHGNPIKYDPNMKHPVSKKTFGELYLETRSRIKTLQEAGYNLVYIWESEWRQLKRKLKKSQTSK